MIELELAESTNFQRHLRTTLADGAMRFPDAVMAQGLVERIDDCLPTSRG